MLTIITLNTTYKFDEQADGDFVCAQGNLVHCPPGTTGFFFEQPTVGKGFVFKKTNHTRKVMCSSTVKRIFRG